MSKINIITYNIGMGVEDNEGERKSNGPEKSALCGVFCFPIFILTLQREYWLCNYKALLPIFFS